jgi:hypothetical protein
VTTDTVVFIVGFIVQLIVFAASYGSLRQKLEDVKEFFEKRLDHIEKTVDNLPCKQGVLPCFPVGSGKETT